jgi:5-methylcytosine-specific restriction endonuclease McrA
LNPTNCVFVLDTDRQPLTPGRPARARQLLSTGQAAVFRRYPFTIILKKPMPEAGAKQFRIKIDPGSKTTGIALVDERSQRVVFAAELEHRGQQIKESLNSRRSLRQFRRYRKTRYRKARFLNRTKPEGWLPPNLLHRVETAMTWVRRLQRYANVAAVSMELVRFDTQQMENPEISGVEYQQGTLAGYEVREYVLEKWGRQCAYCGAKEVPLEIDHIHPKSKHGSDRVSNLTLACRPCNQKKNNRDIREFVRDQSRLQKILSQAKAPLRDAAAVNAARWKLFEVLQSTGLPLEVGTGGRTKFNRFQLGLPKAHWIDAACIGPSGEGIHADPCLKPLSIRACGHGTRQMCGTNKHGLPIRHRTRQKLHFGFQTGDIVRAIVPKGKKAGLHRGRVLCRARGSFDIQTGKRRIGGISYRYCTPVHREDGYAYR